MDPTKADLETTIRQRRARLDRRLTRLETRLAAFKHRSRRAGVITGAVVLTLTVVGTITLLVRSFLAHRRRHSLFAR